MNAQERAKAVSRIADELKPYFATHDELHEFKIRHVADGTPIYAPSVITSRGGSWQVRSRATGQVHHLQYSMGRIINVISCLKSGAKPPASCGAELEYVQKALSDASSSNGGTLIPQEWVDFVIPELGAQTVVLKANPNVIPMQHDIINLPGFGSAAAIQWLAEAASSTESSPGTTNIQLQLHTARLLTAASREWMQDATPETDSALQANLVRTMARGVDLAFLAGTGSSNQPTGLLNISSQPTVMCGGTSAVNGASPTIDDFSALVDLLDEGNAPQEGRAWFMSVRSRRRLRDLKDSQGRPLYSQNLQEKDPVELYGYPIYTSTQISNTQTVGTSSTASSVILAAMSDVYVGQGIKSKGLEIAISDQALFANNQIAIRLLYRTDIQPGHTASVALLTGVL